MKQTVSDLVGRGAALLRRLREQAVRLKAEEAALHTIERTVADKSLEPKVATVDLSTSSVAKATLAVFGLVALAWFLMEIKEIIILFFIAGFLSVAFDPIVDWLERFRIPRGIGILMIYVVFIGAVSLTISSFIPILAVEIPNLARQILDWLQSSFGVDTSVIRDQIAQMQQYFADIQKNLSQENIQAGLSVLGTVGTNALAVFKSVAGGLFSFVMVLVITFFMVVEEDGIKKFLIALFPRRFHQYIIEKSSLIEDKFGSWLRGQILLMLAVGTMVFIALKLAGINYAASLGTLAGLTELLPYVGPIAALIPALIIAASQGGLLLMLVVIAIYVAVQQLEGNVLVPLVMEKAVGLSPVVVMFAMLVGASFPEIINPIVGIILSVPLATAISVFVQDYATKQK